MGFGQAIVEFFLRLWDFLVNMFSMLGYAISMLLVGNSTMTLVLGYVPAVIGGCAFVAIAILMVRFFLMK